MLVARFFSAIAQRLRFAGSAITRPFQAVVYNLRTFNPLRGVQMVARQIGQGFSYVLQWPAKQLGIKLPGVSGGANITGGEFHPRQAIRDWWASLPGRGGEARRRTKAAKRAQFSQIHLVDSRDGARTVLHIGTIIGRSESDLTLEPTGTKPVYLRFSQVDPGEHGAPMRLTYLAGDADLKVDGVLVEHDALIQSGSVIRVAKQELTCQLYAWDKTPVVTRVDAGWATTVGPVRDINEDAIGIYQHPDAYLFAIADGVGGGQDGDLLSAFSVQYLLAVFDKNVKFKLRWRDIFAKAFQYINAEARYFAKRSPYPAGTTLTAVVVKNFEAHVAHVGDSRLYLLHNSVLQQVTTDHAKRVEVELETRHANQADEPPPMRDVLLKAIGKSDSIEPDLFSLTLQPGDRLLLCTDGLTNAVPLEEIARIFVSTRAEPAARQLINLATEREATDNVSAIVFEVLADPYIEDVWSARGGDRVYVGYDRGWPLKLRKPGEPVTQHPEAHRAGCLAILAGIIVVVVFLIWSGRGGGSAASASDGLLVTPIRGMITATPLPATSTLDPILGVTGPRPSMTPSPTATASATPAPILTSTPVPTLTASPTVDLKPTSTLRPPSG
ncbi:MAG: protein phosphatase 2C domain-containing protein [Anaerolineae bacterium]|nr:protein phosphatase 2C domain-containing protein [Anaerolineae bacterium]